jgi:hypothetical protein
MQKPYMYVGSFPTILQGWSNKFRGSVLISCWAIWQCYYLVWLVTQQDRGHMECMDKLGSVFVEQQLVRMLLHQVCTDVKMEHMMELRVNMKGNVRDVYGEYTMGKSNVFKFQRRQRLCVQ